MAQIEWYVDPDAVGAGNGTSWADAYTSLNAFEAAEATNLIVDGNNYVVHCRASSGTVDDTSVTFLGWTTDDTHDIVITSDAADRHSGVWTALKYRLEGTNSDILLIYEDYVSVTWLQIGKSAGNGDDQRCIRVSVQTAVNNLIQINHCIVKQSGNNAFQERAISIEDADTIAKISNNIVYGLGTDAAVLNTAIYMSNCSIVYCYNNTVVSGFYNIGRAAGTVIVKNNACSGAGDKSMSGTFDANSRNNALTINVSSGAFGVQADSGTTDGAAANKLIQSGQNFLTTVSVGMIIHNTTDNTYTYVTAVDDNENLSINDDIMANGENYIIYHNRFGTISFIGAPDYHLDGADTTCQNQGVDLSADADLAITDDIDGQARAAPYDIGADQIVSAGTVVPQIQLMRLMGVIG